MSSLVATCVLLKSLPEAAWKWIYGLGGPGLILLGLADNSPIMSAPPGTIEVFVVLLAAHHGGWWWAYYALMATIGEVLGGYVTYQLAEKGGQVTLEKKVGKSRADKIYKLFEKHGLAAVLVGSVLPPPFPFTSVLITAGVMQYPKSKFLPALTAGRALRFLGVAGLSRIFGRQIIDFFSAHYEFMFKLLMILAAAAGIAVVVYLGWYRRRSKREKQADQSQASTAKSTPTHAAR